ncbi:hypothetical protein SAMN05443247_08789 [Bradyrhizobium erythrophlei]|nr:hypothetical protein SAMN05443247_08789 [Bradyrhizobium erythrophlei]
MRMISHPKRTRDSNRPAKSMLTSPHIPADPGPTSGLPKVTAGLRSRASNLCHEFNIQSGERAPIRL